MNAVEFRVRTVSRYIVTKYEWPDVPQVTAGKSSLIGEFDSTPMAEAVATALHESTPNSRLSMDTQREYVVVAVHTYKVDTLAYFAHSLKEAEQIKEKAESDHGTEFRIYSR